jgi:hypothetical protein
MSALAYSHNTDQILRLFVAADDEGCLRVEQTLDDGRAIISRFRYMEDLAALVNDKSFAGQVDFAPCDAGLRCVLETVCRQLRGELH